MDWFLVFAPLKTEIASTLGDCGSGMAGVTVGFLLTRALFCPPLDTTKTPTRDKRAGAKQGEV